MNVSRYDRGRKRSVAEMASLMTYDELRAKARKYLHSRTMVNWKTGCWEWEGAVDANGYTGAGNPMRPGTITRGHRISYEAFNGPITEGLHVRHVCNNPSCTNPEHLLLGTPKDNAEDRMKARRASGADINSCPKCEGPRTRNSQGNLKCKPCHNKYHAGLRAKKRAKQQEARNR